MTDSRRSDRILSVALWMGSALLVLVSSYSALRHNPLNLIWLGFAVVTLAVMSARVWHGVARRLVVAAQLVIATGLAVVYVLPLTSIGVDVVKPARSVEIVTGTLGAVHRKTKLSGWLTRGAEHARVTFMHQTPLDWNTPLQFVTFGHRNSSYVVDEIWFGTDILGVPFKLARLREYALLKSAHLPKSTGFLQREGEGYRVINRFDANPLFRLKADRGFVSTYIVPLRAWSVRMLWLLAFIAVIVGGLMVNRYRFTDNDAAIKK